MKNIEESKVIKHEMILNEIRYNIDIVFENVEYSLCVILNEMSNHSKFVSSIKFRNRYKLKKSLKKKMKHFVSEYCVNKLII
jgi:hypothetical protein